MLLIGYGIAALVIIIILIAVNVRASRNPSSGSKQEEEKQAEAKATAEAPSRAEPSPSPPTDKPEAERTEEPAASIAADRQIPPAESARTAEPATRSVTADRTGTKDQGFRDAIRQLKTGPGSEPARADSTPRKEAIISDSDYRKAMRDLRKSGQENDSPR